MTGEDVELCAEIGLHGVIVSNHGGRHLDNTLATVEVVAEAVAAASGKARDFSRRWHQARRRCGESPGLRSQGRVHRPSAILGSRRRWRAGSSASVGYTSGRDGNYYGEMRPADDREHRFERDGQGTAVVKGAVFMTAAREQRNGK